MTLPDKKCPRCRLWNSGSALVCDCGYDFKSGQVTVSPLALSASAKPELRDKLQQQMVREANSFLWIAGLQVPVFFSIPFPESLLTVFTAVAFLISGLLARRRSSWGFYLGAITGIVQVLLCFAIKNYWGAGIEFIALYWIWRGLQALRLSSMLSQTGNPQIMREAADAAKNMSLYRTPGLAFRMAFWIWIVGLILLAFQFLRFMVLR